MKNIIIIASIIFPILISCRNKNESEWQQLDGYIPNEASAVKLAELVLLTVYGDSIDDYKPFNARLMRGNVWLVEGKLEKDKLGGVPFIIIQKSDAKIIKVGHGK